MAIVAARDQHEILTALDLRRRGFALDFTGASPAIATADKPTHESAATTQEIVLASIFSSPIFY